MKTKELVLNGITAVAVVSAVATSVSAVRRGGSLLSASPPQNVAAAKPRPVTNWRPLLSTGHRIGPADALVTLIEFGDFECPACAAYEKMLDSIRHRHPREFAVVFHHFPLPYHHLAYPLARASECAAAQGKFVEFHDLVYAHPESLGIIPVSALGRRIGMPRETEFDQCFDRSTPVPEVENDIETAKRIGVPGTPGVIMDGQLRSADLRLDELESLIARRAAKKSKAARD